MFLHSSPSSFSAAEKIAALHQHTLMAILLSGFSFLGGMDGQEQLAYHSTLIHFLHQGKACIMPSIKLCWPFGRKQRKIESLTNLSTIQNIKHSDYFRFMKFKIL